MPGPVGGAGFGDLQAREVNLGEEWRRQVMAQKILGDVAPAEALAKVGIMGCGDVVHSLKG